MKKFIHKTLFFKYCILSAAVIKDISRDKMFIAFGCKTVNCTGDGTEGNKGVNNKILRYDDRFGHKEGYVPNIKNFPHVSNSFFSIFIFRGHKI